MTPCVPSVYALSPAQQGILFHALRAESPGQYFQQYCYSLRGVLDESAFAHAWARAVRRHPVLRTAFRWEGGERPQQVVHDAEAVSLPLTMRDWEGLATEEQQVRVEAFLDADRAAGFDLSAPPLARAAVLRLSSDRFLFVWSHHHLVLDGWSNLVLLKEVLAQYVALRGGIDLQLAEPPPYAAYIDWIARVTSDTAMREAERYWRDRLRPLTEPTPIALESPGPAAAADRAPRAKQSVRLPRETWARVTALAREQRLTTSTVVQGCWAVLLARYASARRVLFGTTVSGRPTTMAGSDSMVGLFVNVVPTLAEIPPDAPICDWLRGFQREQAIVRDAQHVPLVDIHGWSAIPRGTPLFESLVSFENYPVDAFEQAYGDAGAAADAGLPFAIDGVRIAEHSNYPLTVIASPSDTLLLEISYATRRFAAHAIERLLAQLAGMLRDLVDRPDQMTSQLATRADTPLPTSERLSGGQRPQTYVAREAASIVEPIHDAIARVARTTPDAVAIAFQDARITYRCLDARANQLAAHLIALGVAADSRVAIYTGRTPNLLIALLGVLKAGAAYVPIDPELPAARVAAMLDDAQAMVIVTERAAAERLPMTWAQVIDLDREAAAIAARPDLDPCVAIVPEQLAYAIYTSGSTGRAKAVGVSHGALANYVRGVSARLGFEPGWQFAFISTQAADLGNTTLFPALLGGTLHVIAEEVATDGALFAEYASRQPIDGMKITPSHLRALLATGDATQLLPRRRLVLGGEASSAAWVAELIARRSASCEIWNHYGPTETTVGVLACEATPELIARRQDLPIGQPFGGARVEVMDLDGHPAPLGAPGELWIGGSGVARGYLQQPALTAERFVPDPLGAPGSRAYRTGDRVRWTHDERLEFLGRVDHQIKLRGYRIELGDIEATLAAHASVDQAIVITRGRAGSEPQLVAYVRPSGASIDLDALRQHARAQLPAYMMPAAFVAMERWPLLPNGKLDRAALPEPDAAAGVASRDDAPRTAIEEIVAGVWREVLRLDAVGRDEDFFALGGHSLLATQVIGRIRTVLQVDLPIRVLFETPTIAGVAADVEARRSQGRASVVPPLVPVDRGRALPLSFAQQRLWFIDQLQPGQATYNVPKAVRLRGDLQVAALRASLHEIVRRHEVLRTVFVANGGAPSQIVLPPFTDPMGGAGGPLSGTGSVIDLSGCPSDARDALARRLASEEAARPFDLACGPLLRAALLRLDAREHVLLLTLHHIASDGWSIGILIDELTRLYRAACAGDASPLDPLPVQYGDVAVWQRSWLHGALLDAQVEYWRTQLSELEPLELPTDRPRPPTPDTRGARLAWTMPPATAARVRALSQREGVTPFMTLLAAFQILLGRLAGRTDVAVGTDVANRIAPGVEPLIGFFVNQLVLRTTLAGDPTFVTLLAQVRARTLDAYAHQDVPFEKLVEELAPGRHANRAPLCQVKFVLQNVPRAEPTMTGLEIEGYGRGAPVAKVDLTFALDADGDAIGGLLEYATALYDESGAARLLDMYERLLAQAVEQPERRISTFVILSAAEQRQLAIDWNACPIGSAARSWSVPATAHEGVAATARTRPDAIAAVHGADHLSYATLMSRANQLAHYLQTLGVGPEVIVAICLPRGLSLAIALLGVLKAGGAYLPIDPAAPARRIGAMLDDAQPAVLVTESSVSGALPASWAREVDLERQAAQIAAQPTSDPPGDAAGRGTPESLAYVMYTSGTTGRPKGVMVTHRGICNLAAAQNEAFGVTAASAVLQFASVGFDATTSEWSTAWFAGARLVFASADDVRPGPELSRLVSRHAVDIVTWPPSLAGVLAASEAPSLKTLVLAGEPSHAPLVARWARAGCRVLNAYGPTEATVCATMSAPLPATIAGTPPIGGPMPNVEVYVLDESGALAPVGTEGELHVGGAGVSRGYLHQPVMTAEAFVPDPFSARLGARLYRTGDRARWRADGQLEFIGRRDRQVKLRGHRIELAEVEAALQTHPGVRHCAAIVRSASVAANAATAAAADGADGGDGVSEAVLVAYVVGDPSVVTWDSLRRHVRERLPESMTPSAMVLLDTLPMTVSGKLDVAALPAPARESTIVAQADAPASATEEIVAGFWCELLHRPRVGREESFFLLGGHSLLATQVIARVRSAFDVELPLRVLFEAPTVAGLAAAIEAARREPGAAPAPPPIVATPREARPPLAFAQQRLWFLDRLQPGSAVYNCPAAVRLRGPLDAPALRAALTDVVRRHEVLRTRVPERDGEPWQEIAPPAPVPMPLVQLDALPEPHRTRLAERLAAAEARAPFDLARGPLLRARLLQLAPEDHVLLLTAHHIVCDGWSVGLLVQELAALYTAACAGAAASVVSEATPRPAPQSVLRRAPELPPLPVQYADVAIWQRRWLRGAVLESALRYWTRQLAELPVLDLPTDFPRPPVQDARGQQIACGFAPDLVARMRALCQQQGVTPFMLLLALFQALLARLSGQQDLAVGTDVANRTRTETEHLIGFFVNQLVLRGDLSGDPAMTQLLARTRGATLAAFAHQDAPFEQLVEALAPVRDPSRSPLFQVKLVLQNTPRAPLALPALRVDSFGRGAPVAKFDLTFALEEQPDGGLAGRLEFATALYRPATARRLLDQFERLLVQTIDHPERRLSELSLLSADEEQQLLVSFNDGGAIDEPSRTVHEGIAAQAVRRPEAIALVHGATQVTYGELNRRASQLAAFLHASGIGPDMRVAVCLARGPALIVAFLGVLKAGAAYVPIDPAYPSARIGAILEDAGTPLVLTESARLDALPATWAQVITLDRDWDALIGARAADDDEVVGRESGPDALAYVMYTSGSTGKPKGVMIAHAGVTNLIAGLIRDFEITPDSAVLQAASIGFDAAAQEWSSTLTAGARLVLIPPDVRLPSAEACDLMERHGIAIVTMPPSILAALPVRPLPALRTLCMAGEPAPAALAARWSTEAGPHAGGRRIFNAYGPTEGTVCATLTIVDPADATLPIGRPLPNVRLYVLDAAGELAPVGVPGELYLGGAGVARGYVNQPRLTAARFVPDARGGPGARLYRTGDRVRWRADGQLEFLGRRDHQVKLRGYRIELAEIESVLQAHPAVRQCAAIVREDSPGDPRLIAYVLLSDPEIDDEPLFQRLREQLPAYMTPSAIVRLHEWPLTPHGKIDTRALPRPADLHRSPRAIVDPRDSTETQLRQIWEALLERRDIGIHDDFFLVGGHSLRAVALAARLSRVYGRDVPVRVIFEAPTIAAQAGYLRQEIALAPPSRVVLLNAASDGPALFCVHPAGGLVHPFVALARALGAECRLYGFQAVGLDEGAAPLRTIEEMAARYVRDMREMHPEGPYHLAGLSMGGAVAFEMARRLEAEGEAAALVALFDPTPVGVRESESVTVPEATIADFEADLQRWELWHLIEEAEETLGIDRADWTSLDVEERARRYLQGAQQLGTMPADVTVPQYRRFLRVFGTNTLAMARYRPAACRTRLTLFRTDPLPGHDESYGWSRVAAGGLDLHLFSGRHGALIAEPHVQTLAQQLQACMRAGAAAAAGRSA